MTVTPKYTLKAIEKYNQKFDKILVRLPAGYGDIIREKIGMSGNAYIKELVENDLKRRGLLAAPDTGDNIQDAGINTGNNDICPFD